MHVQNLTRLARGACRLLALAGLCVDRAGGQEAGAQVIPLVTRATPTVGGRSLTEAYLTQPVVAATVRGFGGRLSALGMLNFEGATIRRGELNTGTYGEGFVDRRHPHSYVHELLASARTDVDLRSLRLGVSVTAGRGFAPFGSDDPMVRPFVKYPVNHHLAQLLERLVVIAAVRSGAVALEGALFNGDEPTTPSSAPAWSRFGDSWSARATVRPAPSVEVVASVARVQSPEFREGLGLDQRKRSLVVRFEDAQPSRGASRYVLAEWARTHDDRRGQVAFTYTSFLAEGAYCLNGRWSALRVERATRPEEHRLIDAFRTPRPQIEFAILGRTRWTSLTAAAGTAALRGGVLTIAPFAEVTYARPERVEELAAFVPLEFYGSGQLWLLSVGARVHVGRRHRRMGRYGVAAEERASHAHAAGRAAAPDC